MGDLPSVTHYSCSVYIHNVLPSGDIHNSMVHLLQREAIISDNIESRAIIEADLRSGSGRQRLIINELEDLRYTDNTLIITLVPMHCGIHVWICMYAIL